MHEQPKPPWNSRERRWSLRWQVLLIFAVLFVLWTIWDVLYMRFFVVGHW